MRAAFPPLVLVVAGCAYRPGSFHSLDQPFAGLTSQPTEELP